MKMLLQSKDLWEQIVDDGPGNPGEAPMQADQVEAHEVRGRIYREWRAKARKAMNFIAMHTDEGNSNLIYNAQDGREAWEILSSHHMTMSLGNKMRTLKKVNECKLLEGGSMPKHLNEMVGMFNKLAALGDPVAEDRKITTILSSVEKEYGALTTAIMSWNRDRMTMHEVKERLVEEWEKKTELEHERVKEEAMATKMAAKMMAKMAVESMAVSSSNKIDH